MCLISIKLNVHIVSLRKRCSLLRENFVRNVVTLFWNTLELGGFVLEHVRIQKLGQNRIS